jgi:hypothetical protein
MRYGCVAGYFGSNNEGDAWIIAEAGAIPVSFVEFPVILRLTGLIIMLEKFRAYGFVERDFA